MKSIYPGSSTGTEPPFWWSLFPAIGALLVYLQQTPWASGDKDGGEFTLVLATGGSAHPTGYPLYTLLGHAFVSLAHSLGASWPFAANAWSAIGGAVAVLLLSVLASRLMSPSSTLGRVPRFALGLLPTTLFALNPIWTYETTLAEVNSWHLAWSAGAACLFVTLARRIDAAQGAPGFDAVIWGFVCGLGAAHHVTSIFASIPFSVVLFLLALKRRGVSAREFALVFAGAAVPLLSYTLLAWRAFHPLAWNWPTLEPSWSSIWAHISGQLYKGLLGHFAPSTEQKEMLSAYVWPWLWVGIPSLTTAAALTRSWGERRLLWGFIAAIAGGTLYAFSYGVPDPSSYFLAPLALGLAGLSPLLSALAERRAPWPLLTRLAVAGLALGCLALIPGWLSIGTQRRHVFENLDQQLHKMWESIPVEQGIILCNNDMYTRLLEYQLLRGEKPGLEVEFPLMFTYWPSRYRFMARHGFDPVEGIALPRGVDGDELNFAGVVGRAINSRTSLPVIIFDLHHNSVRQLRKP